MVSSPASRARSIRRRRGYGGQVAAEPLVSRLKGVNSFTRESPPRLEVFTRKPLRLRQCHARLAHAPFIQTDRCVNPCGSGPELTVPCQYHILFLQRVLIHACKERSVKCCTSFQRISEKFINVVIPPGIRIGGQPFGFLHSLKHIALLRATPSYLKPECPETPAPQREKD